MANTVLSLKSSIDLRSLYVINANVNAVKGHYDRCMYTTKGYESSSSDSLENSFLHISIN